MLSQLILIAWLAPFAYGTTTLLGELTRRRNYRKYCMDPRDVERLVLQIPTLGNFETTNRTFDTVRGYDLPIPLECWVVVEEGDQNRDKYNSDRVIVVPKEFSCGALYKARALEYARRLRLSMVDKGELTSKYLLMQADDDSTPSKEFVQECIRLDADLIVGTITPRARGIWNTILDYERCVACATACNLWTNLGVPVWAHGEGFCVSPRVDRSIEYSFATNAEDLYFMHKLSTIKIISSEDMIYTHKTALTGKYKLYNSSKPVYITPPLTFRDAIKQRRRWEWGHLRIVQHGLLPLRNRVRVAVYETIGVAIYIMATVGIALRMLGVMSIESGLVYVTYTTLALWFILRGYSVGKVKGVKHALAAMLTSYLTVTLNFVVHIIGLVKGDPKSFEVIAKA